MGRGPERDRVEVRLEKRQIGKGIDIGLKMRISSA